MCFCCMVQAVEGLQGMSVITYFDRFTFSSLSALKL